MKNCKVCGKEFKAQYGETLCSSECRRARRKSRATGLNRYQCKYCFYEGIGRRGQRFCSDTCRNNHHQNQARGKPQPISDEELERRMNEYWEKVKTDDYERPKSTPLARLFS